MHTTQASNAFLRVLEWTVRALPLLRIKLSGISGRSDSEYGTTTLCGIQLAWQLTRWRISSSGFSGPLAVRLSFQPLAESMRHPRDLCNPNLLHVLHMISAVIVWSVTRIEGFEARWSAAGPVARYSSAVASAAVPLPGTINITVFKLYRTPEFSPDPPGSDKNWDLFFSPNATPKIFNKFEPGDLCFGFDKLNLTAIMTLWTNIDYPLWPNGILSNPPQ